MEANSPLSRWRERVRVRVGPFKNPPHLHPLPLGRGHQKGCSFKKLVTSHQNHRDGENRRRCDFGYQTTPLPFKKLLSYKGDYSQFIRVWHHTGKAV
jgi:hypothetical protein